LVVAFPDGGLEVVFDWAIDGGGWPGPLAEVHDTSVGETWLGPLGLLGRLELELGLPSRHATPLERVIALTSTMSGTNGFWARSFDTDPIATARRLLDDRDTLVTWGWSGQPASERLAALWSATAPARPGVPDRLRVVLDALVRRQIDLASVRVVDPVDHVPPLWQQVFVALQRQGVRVLEQPLPVVPSAGDLAGARASGFTPIGDGTLQLLRPHGSLAAAESAGSDLVRWAGVDLPIHVAPSRPAPAVDVSREPGTITIGRSDAMYPPARMAPSSAAPVPSMIGEVVTLGPRISLAGKPDMEAIGDAIHAFLAADRPDLGDDERLDLASTLLASHGVPDHVADRDVVTMATRLWTWIAARFPMAHMRREWPIAYRDPCGTIVAGTADLVLVDPARVIVIDHKTFPGSTEAAAERAVGYSGQLAAYATALGAGYGAAVGTWIHFPIRGHLVEVCLDTTPGESLVRAEGYGEPVVGGGIIDET
jgi:hypothetical protein